MRKVDLLLDAARRHDMVLHAAHALRQASEPGMVPKQSLVRDLTVRTLLLTQALIQLAQRFADANLDVIALKGPALSEELFGTLALRDPGDLDLMIRPRDLAAADELLRRDGYAREDRWGADFAAGTLSRPPDRVFHVEYRHPDTNIAVELHWRWFHLEEIMPFEPSLVWRDMRVIRLGGTPVTLLAAPTQLLYLALHAAKHECERLKWVIDLAWLLMRVDAQTVEAAAIQARRLDVLDLFLAPLLLVSWLGLAPLPPCLVADQDRRASRWLAGKFMMRLQHPGSRARIGTWRQRLDWHRTYWRLAAHRDPPRRSMVLCHLIRNALKRG